MKVDRVKRETIKFLRKVRESTPLPLPRLRFETLSSMTRDTVFMVDKFGMIVYWNRAAEKTFGYQSSEIIGRPFYKLILPVQNEAGKQILFDSSTDRIWEHKEFDTVFFRKDGQAVNVRLKFSAAEVGQKWCMIGVAQPVEDYEIEREEIIKRAETQSRLAALGRMAAGKIHEINNQLMIISSFPSIVEEAVLKMFNSLLYELDLLDAIGAGKDIQEGLENIRLAAKKIEITARNFMNFGGRGVDNLVLFSPNEKIENVVKLIEPAFRRGNIEFSKNISSDLPALLGRPGIFEQSIYNLLINAWHATPEKGKIGIKAYRDKDVVIIEISDTGYGIPPEIRDRIFSAFFSTKSKESGSGLGLSLVKRSIEEMGGDITFRTEVDQGTVFIICIPYMGRE